MSSERFFSSGNAYQAMPSSSEGSLKTTTFKKTMLSIVSVAVVVYALFALAGFQSQTPQATVFY